MTPVLFTAYGIAETLTLFREIRWISCHERDEIDERSLS